MLTIGIDPGGSTTGIAVRDGNVYLGHTYLEANKYDTFDHYLSMVATEVLSFMLMKSWTPSVGESSGIPIWTQHTQVRIAVEGVVHPNPHLGMANMSGLLDTAQVLGGIRTYFSDQQVVVVRPGGHGSRPLAAYPPQLVGPRETKGTGILKHARSAWDVAGVAQHQQVAA